MNQLTKAFLLGYAYALGMAYGRRSRLALDDTESGKTQPRDDHGRYVDGNGSNSPEDISSLLTHEIKNVKGADAIDAILKEKKGYVREAFHRKDIGGIDLFWGDEGVGLRHIIKQRQEQGIPIEPFLKKLPDVIENGTLRTNREGNFEIWKDGHTAVVYPVFKGNKVQFLFTAFKQRKPSWMKKKSPQ